MKGGFSSGCSLNGEARKIMEEGCRGFLQKPFTGEEIAVKIGKVIDGLQEVFPGKGKDRTAGGMGG